MESSAKRTLVKSAPELWELADDIARMEAWIADLIGAGPAIPVEVTERQPQRELAWRSAGPGDEGRARISIELAPSGFGTAVKITAVHAQGNPEQALVALEALLDELGSPAKRPFVGA